MPACEGSYSLEGGQEKIMRNTYVYEFYVMDDGWEMFPTVQETIVKIGETVNNSSGQDTGCFLLEDFMEFRHRALKAADIADTSKGFSTPIYTMPLVDNFRPSYALAWKAAKGGWCIVVSEERLLWLENIESCKLKIIDNL
jgi:hypothetical protein